MQLGTLIAGRYRLDDRIAAGGMGEVWRGTDTRLNRVVAVKLLHSGLSGDDRFRARFHQEAQAVAALQSPGIVALYDYGEEHGPEGLVSYLIMELVQGQSLANLIHRRGRLAPGEVLKIIATAAEALDVAHRSHIIHRDIKPANLLVNEDGAVKIVDFGIASARGQAGLTETGTVMGTLSYASPEQLAGRELSGATDLYSLGIVAYECLAGRPPFPGGDPAAVITAHMTGQPAPLPPDVPQPVAQIVMRCLAKDPHQRFGSAAELALACREGRPGPGTGTTAILSPTAQETAPMTRPMTQGMAAAPQPTQAMAREDFSAPPEGRDLPPPRDFEKPERSKTVPILLTVVGALVLVVALVMWRSWGSAEADPDGNAVSEGPASQTATSAAAETEEAEAADETEASQNDREESSNEDTPVEDEAPETSEAPSQATVPNVLDRPLVDAIGALEEAGFLNIDAAVQEGEIPAGQDPCIVTSQDPAGNGDEHAYETTIRIQYWDDGTGCGR